MADEPPDNLIAFPAPVAELRPKHTATHTISRKPRDYTKRQCDHRAAIIDDNARKVTCRHCGAELDPITHLYKMAIVSDRRKQDLENAAQELAALRKRVLMLERIERNARARLKRLGVPSIDDWVLDQLVRKEADAEARKD